MTSKDKNISRRTFLKLFGAGTVATATALAGCKEANKAEQQAADEYKNQVEPPIGKMTYRENPKTKEKVKKDSRRFATMIKSKPTSISPTN